MLQAEHAVVEVIENVGVSADCGVQDEWDVHNTNEALAFFLIQSPGTRDLLAETVIIDIVRRHLVPMNWRGLV